MAFNDPIAELLTKLRNAQRAEHRFVDIYLSKIKKNILDILKQQGFIENYLLDEQRNKMRVFLRYNKSRKPIISGLKRVSKPGLRKYVGCNDIPMVLGGIGIAILSTSQGVMDGKQAREKQVGGELLCYVW